MSQFYADHSAVRRFGSGLASLADGVPTASGYATTWVSLPSGADGEIFANFLGTAREVEGAVAEALTHLDRIMVESVAEVRATADHYETTDAERAAVLDRALDASIHRLRPGGPGMMEVR